MFPFEILSLLLLLSCLICCWRCCLFIPLIPPFRALSFPVICSICDQSKLYLQAACPFTAIMLGDNVSCTEEEIKVSFGYKCNGKEGHSEFYDGIESFPGFRMRRTSRSFSCLYGAALSTNPTLANTNICNGLIGAEILPCWDSPKSFQRIPSSPSLSSKVDVLSSSLQNTLSSLSYSSSLVFKSAPWRTPRRMAHEAKVLALLQVEAQCPTECAARRAPCCILEAGEGA